MNSETLIHTQKSLDRVANFEVSTLIRREVLGEAFEFSKAVEPARKLVDLFKKLPTDRIIVFPDQQLSQIQTAADAVFALFVEIEKFVPQVSDAASRRDLLISSLSAQYQQTFNVVSPLVAFLTSQTLNFGDLADQGRAVIQGVRDQAAEVVKSLSATSESAVAVLETVRKAAAEQGITKEATFFANESFEHKSVAKKWRNASVCMALVVFVYAVGTLFFPQIEWLRADSPATAVQLAVSKVLVFSVLVYALFQCVKNYNANIHNAILNKHRQNSLLTYTTLVEAGGTQQVRDVVIQHAAAAIYSPSDTGYIRNEERGYGGANIIGMLSKAVSTSNQP